MPSDQTRGAILAAAERLYADRGFGDVTLRDIVAAANVNLAAVNYHFGSKDELIAELFVTRSLALNRERLRELRAAEETGDGHADVSEILRALTKSWVMETAVAPNSRTHFIIRLLITSAMIGSSPVVGSSKKIISGSAAIARASATRFCIPPDSSAGRSEAT